MTGQLYIPGYDRIEVVQTMDEALTAPMGKGVNGLVFPRPLPEPFDALAAHFARQYPGQKKIVELFRRDLEEIVAKKSLPSDVRDQADFIVKDMAVHDKYESHSGQEAVLKVIPAHGYGFDPLTYRLHADTTFNPRNKGFDLIAYSGVSTRGARDDRVEADPELAGDFIYNLKPGAELFAFGLGNVFRLAASYIGNEPRENGNDSTPGLIHLAEDIPQGANPRLLLRQNWFSPPRH